MLPAVEFQYNATKKSREVILIAGDYDNMRNYICDCLVADYDIMETSNGEEAWQFMLTHTPDLIIADLLMSEMSGIDLCKKVRQDMRTDYIPFVILTGHADVKTKIVSLNGGADDYIAKPFYVEELKARIHNLIETRKRMRNKYSAQMWLNDSSEPVLSADEKFLSRVGHVIKENLDNNLFGVEMFAREVGMSTVQLYRKLHAVTGKSPNDFIRDIRLRHAAGLLQRKVGNVSEIAYQVGFTTLSYFSKCFREKFGCTPHEYAKCSFQVDLPTGTYEYVSRNVS